MSGHLLWREWLVDQDCHCQTCMAGRIIASAAVTVTDERGLPAEVSPMVALQMIVHLLFRLLRRWPQGAAAGMVLAGTMLSDALRTDSAPKPLVDLDKVKTANDKPC